MLVSQHSSRAFGRRDQPRGLTTFFAPHRKGNRRSSRRKRLSVPLPFTVLCRSTLPECSFGRRDQPRGLTTFFAPHRRGNRRSSRRKRLSVPLPFTVRRRSTLPERLPACDRPTAEAIKRLHSEKVCPPSLSQTSQAAPYFTTQEKFAASSVLPDPEYFATIG
jgi:hypothetical protein